ncbi:MAG: AMP-binding protein [Pseudohongiellaceae bacterium]
METLPEELRHDQFNTLNEVIDTIAKNHSDRPAFSCLGTTLSYGEVLDYSERFAAWLVNASSLEPGDRIAVQLPNLLQFPVVLYGALKAGLIVVNTNPLYTAHEMRHQFRDSGVKAIVILDSMCSKLQEILPETDIQTVIVTRLGDLQPFPKRTLLNFAARYIKRMVPAWRIPGAISFKRTIAARDELAKRPDWIKREDPALILYTGGTTGVSKGAMLSHGNLIANMMQVRCRALLVLDDKTETVGAPLPLYHTYAFLLHCLVLPLAGNHNVLVPDPRDIGSLLGLWRRYRFTGFVGINTLYQAMLRHGDFDKLDFSVLRFAGGGGMAMSSSVMKDWEQRTGCAILEGYGLTECSPVVATNIQGRNKPGTVGPVVPETEVITVDDNGTTVGTGERGELWVRGPQVMLGYWQNPQATKDAITPEGWFKTGDYAEIDEEGFIRIVDRKKDMILVSGFNVFPNEVEDWVNNHPDVAESAAIGVPSESSGEEVKLFVVKSQDSLDEEAVIAHCRKGLTGYKVPKQVVFVDELPKSNVGKVLRRQLRD